MGQHVQVIVRQLVTQDIGPVEGTQDTDPDRSRSDNLAVELLMLFEPLGVDLRRDKDFTLVHSCQGEQRDPHQHVEQDRVEDQHADPFQYHIHRNRVDDAQR
ncbi:hypothetical protein D3C75_404600 [compost metagenome]